MVIFYIKKETDEFKSYQIIEDKTKEELESAIKNFNSIENNSLYAKIITDKHTILAITSHKSFESIESVVDDFKSIASDIDDQVGNLINIIENMRNDLNELKNNNVTVL